MRTPIAPIAALLVASALLVPACDKGGEKKMVVKKAETKKADAPGSGEAGDSPKGEAEDAAKPAEEPAAEVLSLGAAKIMQKDRPEEALEIQADGKVLVNASVVGSIGADGKIKSSDGQVMMSVDSSGMITMGDKPIPLTVVEGGANMQAPNGGVIEIRFAADGSVEMNAKNADGSPARPVEGAPPPPAMVSEGCTGAVAKTCGLAFAAYMMLGAGAPGPGGTAEVPSMPPPPPPGGDGPMPAGPGETPPPPPPPAP